MVCAGHCLASFAVGWGTKKPARLLLLLLQGITRLPLGRTCPPTLVS